VSELVFFTGTMDSGKSTLALQVDHNHAARGRAGRIFTSHDRAGMATLSSRADRISVLQVETLCWCGERATRNARTVDGEVITEGEVIVLGDVDGSHSDEPVPEVGYEVLCRRHHRRRLSAAKARAAELSQALLPFGDVS
jgi:thymidine kinase